MLVSNTPLIRLCSGFRRVSTRVSIFFFGDDDPPSTAVMMMAPAWQWSVGYKHVKRKEKGNRAWSGGGSANGSRHEEEGKGGPGGLGVEHTLQGMLSLLLLYHYLHHQIFQQ